MISKKHVFYSFWINTVLTNRSATVVKNWQCYINYPLSAYCVTKRIRYNTNTSDELRSENDGISPPPFVKFIVNGDTPLPLGVGQNEKLDSNKWDPPVVYAVENSYYSLSYREVTNMHQREAVTKQTTLY